MSELTPTQDRRVTRLFEWLAVIGSGLIIGALAWMGSTLMDIKQSVAVLQVQTAPSSARMDRIEQKIEAMQQQTGRIERIDTK